MKALEQCHEQGVVHGETQVFHTRFFSMCSHRFCFLCIYGCSGDIKPENIMTTSWNWTVLTDFAPHKPVAIPDDDTSTFHYFFDSMARRRCYIAPERFYTSGRKLKAAKASASLDKADNEDDQDNVDPPSASEKKPDLSLSPAMDVFSLGCTIAEVLLDGECLVDLPSLLQFISMCRANKDGTPIPSLSHADSPALSTLNRIKDPRIRKTISLMTQFSPSDRLSVFSYRHILEEKGVFPSFFGSVLYDLFIKVHWHGTTPDDRVNIICQNYRSIMDEIADCEDSEGSQFFTNALSFLHSDGHLKLDQTIALEQSIKSPSEETLATDFECTRKSNVLDGEDALPRPLLSTKVDLPPGLRLAAERGTASRSKSTISSELLNNVKSTAVESDSKSDKKSASTSLLSLINDFEKLLESKPTMESSESKGERDEGEDQGEPWTELSPKKTLYRDRVYIEEETKQFDFQESSERRSK